MVGYKSRRERNNERVRAFLNDPCWRKLEMRLYKGEIYRLKKDNPDIIIRQTGNYIENTKVQICHIFKKWFGFLPNVVLRSDSMIMGYCSRRHKNSTKINAFLNDSSQEEMEMYLYTYEVKILENAFPEISIRQSGIFIGNTGLQICYINKQ